MKVFMDEQLNNDMVYPWLYIYTFNQLWIAM